MLNSLKMHKIVRQRSREGNICVSLETKIEKQKYVKLNDYITIIIELSHKKYFFAWFSLYIEKEPSKDGIDEENLLPIIKNFIFGQ